MVNHYLTMTRKLSLTLVWLSLPAISLAFAPWSISRQIASYDRAPSVHRLPLANLDDITTLSSTLASSTQHALSTIQPSIVGNLPSFNVAATDGFLSNENIKVAFSAATFVPQIFWLFLIVLPKSEVTKKILGGYGELKLIVSSLYACRGIHASNSAHIPSSPPSLHRNRHPLLSNPLLHSLSLHCPTRWHSPHG
jgi:hypothetical protein